MTNEQMRQWLLGHYPRSSTWPDKVKKMSDAQVFAVYTRLKNKEGRRDEFPDRRAS